MVTSATRCGITGLDPERTDVLTKRRKVFTGNVEREQLIDLTRRACKLARDNTTDLAPATHRVEAREYTSAERH